MRNYSTKIIVLLSLILVFGLPKIGFGQGGSTISEQQQNFARYVQDSIPGVIRAEWKSSVDLWVEADSDDPNAARKIAQEVVYVSQTQQGPGQSFCVHVHDGDYIDLSKICWSAP